MLLAFGLFFTPHVRAQEEEPIYFPVSELCRSAFGEMGNMRREMIASMQKKDYDTAYKLSLEMTARGETSCKDEKDKLLALYLNTAQIQIHRKKIKEAQSIYSNRLDLAEEVYGANSSNLQRYIADLLKLSVGNSGTKEYEKIALRALEARKARFGPESVEYANELLRMARFYEASKDVAEAERFFGLEVDIAEKFPVENADRRERTVNLYRAFIFRRYGDQIGMQKDAELMKGRFVDFPRRDGVLNGLAFSLPRPPYGEQARMNGVQGTVRVSIEIDERGFVISANAVEGHPFLRVNAERAAKSARFLPTYLKGTAVKVTGVIEYNFNSYIVS